MKYVKMLGLLAVAAAALMAFAGTASATTVTGPGGNTTPTIHALSEESAVPGTKHVLLHNNTADIECESTVHGKVEKHGPEVTASGKISHLTFYNCTGGWTVTVNSPGTLEVHHISGSKNGTLTSSGAKVTAFNHIFNITCVYATNNTDIGVVTGGSPATLDITGKIPFVEGSFFCGSEPANWTGSYVTTESLLVDP